MTPSDPEPVPEPDTPPETPKDIARHLLKLALDGSFWTGWTTEGRPSFGELPDAPPDDVTVTDDPLERALIAGVAYAFFTAGAVARQRAEAQNAFRAAEQAVDARQGIARPSLLAADGRPLSRAERRSGRR